MNKACSWRCILRIGPATALGLALAGCATVSTQTGPSTPLPGTPVAPSATPSTTFDFGPCEHPSLPPAPIPANRAVICFYRPWKLLSAACVFTVMEDDTSILLIKNGTFTYFITSPGAHTYGITFGPRINTLAVQLPPGSVTYLRAGVWDENLTLMSGPDALPDVNRLSYAVHEPNQWQASFSDFSKVEFAVTQVRMSLPDKVKLDGVVAGKLYTPGMIGPIQHRITPSGCMDTFEINHAQLDLLMIKPVNTVPALTLIMHAAGQLDLGVSSNIRTFEQRLYALFAAHRKETARINVRMNGRVLTLHPANSCR